MMPDGVVTLRWLAPMLGFAFAWHHWPIPMFLAITVWMLSFLVDSSYVDGEDEVEVELFDQDDDD